MHFPLSFCKNDSPYFSMVHLLHRFYWVDAPVSSKFLPFWPYEIMQIDENKSLGFKHIDACKDGVIVWAGRVIVSELRHVYSSTILWE